jgi:hypothetical protein
LEDKPVFFLEIKEPRKITVPSAREEADDQTRKRMRDLAPFFPLDILNGVSALEHAFLSIPTINELASFLATYLLTLIWRPILLRWTGGIATFWKRKEVNGSKFLLQRARKNATSFKKCGVRL